MSDFGEKSTAVPAAMDTDVPFNALHSLKTFFSARKKFVAIEFDQNLVKLILVEDRQATNSLRYIKVKFLSSAQDAEIVRALRDHLQEMGFRGGIHAAISIPRHAVHARLMRMPSVDPVELQRMIAFEVQNALPLPPEEIVSDFRVVARQDEGYSQVMVVVARRKEVERYLELCEHVGLVVDAVRLSFEATYHAFMAAQRDLSEAETEGLALVDVDFAATNIIVIHKGDLLFSRNIRGGVAELLERMVEAEPASIYQRWIDELAAGVAKTLAMFQKEHLSPQLQKIFLSGWLPKVQFLTARLTENLRVPVAWFDPAVSVEGLQQADSDGVRQNWFSVSALLGMADLKAQNLMDLRPAAARRKQHRRELLKSAVISLALGLYLLFGVLVTAEITLQMRQGIAAEFEDRAAALRPQLTAVNKRQELQQTLKKNLGGTELTADLTARLFEKLPPGVDLSALTFQRGERMVMRGIAVSLAAILELPGALSEQAVFGEVTVTSANRRLQQGGKEIIEFEMRIALRKQD